MDVNGVRLSYCQVNKERREKGFSTWWLGMVDKSSLEIPSDVDLKNLFKTASQKGELRVESRGMSYCIIFLPIGVSKTVQVKFLTAFANYIA